MNESLPLDSRELLARAGWIRGLARELVRDGATAEDVAQEAWLGLARGSGGGWSASRAWIARMVQNLARQRGRAETSRARREQQSARREALPSAAELVERTELHRALVDAVLELGEPYRATILLHHFDGLAPAEIAARRGVPAATVRSQLARGRAHLRARLVERYGGDPRRTLSALAPLAIPIAGGAHGASSWIATVNGGLLAMKLTTIGLSLAGLALAGWIALGVSKRETPEHDALGVQESRSQAPPPLAVHAPEAADERAALGIEGSEALAPEAPAASSDAEPARATDWPQWSEFQDATVGLFDGTPDLDELLEVALVLLERVDLESAAWSKEGTRDFVLVDDPERGRATLSVHPGRVGALGEFSIKTSTPWSVPGYRGSPEHLKGGDAGLYFGLSETGALSSVSAFTQVQHDGDARAPNAGLGKLRTGAFLLVKPEGATWHELTMEASHDAAGELLGMYRNGAEVELYVPGSLDGPRAARLAERLASFRID